MRAGGDGSGGGGGSGGRGGGVRSIFSSAAPSATKIGSSTRSAITISAQMNSSTRAQSNALQLKHLSFFLRCLLSFFLRCLRTRLRLLSCSTSSLSSSSELSSSLPQSPPRRVGTVWKRFSPRILPMVDQRLLARWASPWTERTGARSSPRERVKFAALTRPCATVFSDSRHDEQRAPHDTKQETPMP